MMLWLRSRWLYQRISRLWCKHTGQWWNNRDCLTRCGYCQAVMPPHMQMVGARSIHVTESGDK